MIIKNFIIFLAGLLLISACIHDPHYGYQQIYPSYPNYGHQRAYPNYPNANPHVQNIYPSHNFYSNNNILSKIGQNNSSNYYELIDNYVLNTPLQVEHSINSLAMYLIQPTRNNHEKVRAIYRWITNNIKYDAASYFAGDCRNDSPEKVLWTRKAVCSGYANLFLALGQTVGLDVEKVVGKVRINGVLADHAWNSVVINGQYYWLDSTWDAGYLDIQTKRFIPRFSETHFLVTPQQLANTHSMFRSMRHP